MSAQPITEDLGDWRIVWEPDEYCVNFKVYEIIARAFSGPTVPAHDGNGVAEFARPGQVSAISDPTHILSEAITFMTGFLKWDCCCHFYFTVDNISDGDKDAYFHFDGPSGWQSIHDLLTHLQKTAPQYIAHVDSTLWDLNK